MEVDLCTPAEAAELLKLSVKTLANSRSGYNSINIPFVKLGRAVRYRRSDLLRYIEDNTLGLD